MVHQARNNINVRLVHQAKEDRQKEINNSINMVAGKSVRVVLWQLTSAEMEGDNGHTRVVLTQLYNIIGSSITIFDGIGFEYKLEIFFVIE